MMRILIILAIAILAGSCVMAQKNPASGSTPGPVPQIQRNLRLEQAIQARNLRIKGLLQPEARIKLDQVARVLFVHMTSGSKNINFLALARQEVHSRFSQLSIEQLNLLCFYVLAEVARHSAVQAGQSTMQDSHGRVVEGKGEGTARSSGEKIGNRKHAQQHTEGVFSNTRFSRFKYQIAVPA
jgi:hypothetical protein